MSDEINWIPVGTWSTMALFQLGGAIIDFWKLWRRSRRALTGYEKVEKGELVNGWRIAVADSSVSFAKHEQSLYAFVFPPWPKKESDGTISTDADPLSLLLAFDHEMPNGRNIFFVSRYSLVADVSSDIFQMIYDAKEWDREGSCYVTDRVVGVMFRKIGSDQYRLVLIDVVRKSHRFISIKTPEENVYAVAIAQGNVKKNQLNVIFGKLSLQAVDIDDEAPPVFRLEMYDVTYEIPSSGNVETPIRSSVWQSISIPIGQRRKWEWHLQLGTPMFVVYDPDNIGNVDDHRLVTYDQAKGWSVQSLGNWATTMQNSKLMNAADASGLLNPPESWYWSPLPPLRNLTWVKIGHPAGSSLFCETDYGSILQRSMRPPLLKRVAAEIFCRKNPKTKFASLKKAIGFDIFDGMLDEDDKDLPVVRFE